MKGFVDAIKFLDQEKNVSGSTRLARRTRFVIAHISRPLPVLSLSLSLLPRSSHPSPLPARAVTADCGYFFNLQAEARKHTKKPVFMSSLCAAPSVAAAYAPDELIAIFTANKAKLEPMRDLIKEACGIDPEDKRFIIVDCRHVPDFGDAVALGLKVDTVKASPNIVKLAEKTLQENPKLRAIIMECTELPPYSDAVRAATGLPVFDSITTSNAFIASMQDNPLFGANDWQEKWDGVQEKYDLGDNLSAEEKAKLGNAK